MNIKNILPQFFENFRQVTVQAVGGVIAAIIVALSAGFLSGFVIGERRADEKQKQLVEVVTRNDLRRAIEDAKIRLIATGYVMSDIDANLINEKSSVFDSTIVFVDPLGTGKTKSNICQRQRDEDAETTLFDDYETIVTKIKQFRSPRKTGSLLGSRLKLGVIDLYPTMTVMLVDNDLYAYFYPYGEGTNSPVVKFPDYWNAKDKDKRAKFFDDHLNKITQYREKDGGSRTKFLSTDADFEPYEKQRINPCT